MHYTAADLSIIRAFRSFPDGHGLNPQKLLSFIEETISVGGKVSELTLHLARWCAQFEKDEDSWYLCSSVAYGFTWDINIPTKFFSMPNVVPPEHYEKVDTKIAKMLKAGEIVVTTRDRVAGISPLLVVDKDHSGMVEVRLVHDLSSPHGGSINDGQDIDNIKFSTVRDAMILLRPKSLLCKVDIQNAYRSLAMAPKWWALHVFEWRGVVYSDLRLPFGSSGSPACFTRFTRALTRLVRAKGGGCVGYVDDFCGMGTPAMDKQ